MNTKLKKIVYNLIGVPLLIRKLQWYCIYKYLEINKSDKVLDLGAGNLIYSNYLKKYSNYVYCSDLKFDKYILESKKNQELYKIISNGKKLPFKDRTFDKILLSSILHMVKNPSDILNECKRVKKNNGFIVFSVPVPYLYLKYFIKISNLIENNKAKYNENLQELAHKYKTDVSIGYFENIDEIKKMVIKANLKIISYTYSPNRFTSFFTDFSTYLFLKFGNLGYYLTYMLYPVLYPISMLSDNKGSEIIVKIK